MIEGVAVAAEVASGEHAGSAATLEPATLVIPTRDRPTLVEGAIRSVLAGSVVPDEIVIVDQSPACAGAIEAIAATSDTSIRHVHSRTVGVSRARNLGAEAASHDVVLFIDDDVYVAAPWCRAIREALAQVPGGVITGPVVEAEPERPGGFAPSTTSATERRVHDRPSDVDVLSTASCAMRRTTFVDIGGFDARLGPGTRFPAAEDNDLAHRLLSAGAPIVFEPGVIVAHRAWRAGSERIPLRWRYGRGQGAFLAKHVRARRNATGPRLRALLRRYASRAAREIRHDRRAAFADLAHLAGIVVGFLEWAVTQRTFRGGGGTTA